MTIFGAMPNEEAILDRLLAIEPNDVETKSWRAFVELDWKADTRPFHQLIDSDSGYESCSRFQISLMNGSTALWPNAMLLPLPML